jgi:hypothetical protein
MNIPRWHRNVLAIGFLTASAGCLSADTIQSPTLALTPSPDLSGGPGSAVGWGFTIVNNTSNYLEFSSSQFCLDPVLLTPALSCTSPLTGVFNDIIVANDPIIGPYSSLSEDFDPIGFTSGIGYFDIDPNATYLWSDVGQVVLIYDGYDQDPNSGSATQLLFSVPLAADASVTVTEAEAAVPEPATLGFVAAALPILAIMALQARRRKSACSPPFQRRATG